MVVLEQGGPAPATTEAKPRSAINTAFHRGVFGAGHRDFYTLEEFHAWTEDQGGRMHFALLVSPEGEVIARWKRDDPFSFNVE